MKRRDFLKWNALAAAGAATPTAVTAMKNRGYFSQTWGKAKSVVVLYMAGGPSQIELFDYKPALVKYAGQMIPSALTMQEPRGGKIVPAIRPFKRHGESGQWVSDLFPEIAKLVDEITFIKSYTTHDPNHTEAQLAFNTGVPFAGQPYAGAWIDYALKKPAVKLPNSFVITDPCGPTRIGNLGWQSNFLPHSHSQFVFSSAFQARSLFEGLLPNENGASEEFLKKFAKLQGLGPSHDTFAAVTRKRLDDMSLICSMREEILKIVNLDNVSDDEKKMYALDDEACAPYGEQLLMARRMVEQGVPFIQVISGTNEEPTNWDHHNVIDQIVPMARKVDRPTYGFIMDLKQRGLLDDTIVFWGGEIGKGPTIDLARANATGRPHNIYAGTVWMAGAGVKKGFCLGETDELSWRAVKDRVEMGDIWATIMHVLGIDHQALELSKDGKSEMRLTRKYHRVLHEILG